MKWPRTIKMEFCDSCKFKKKQSGEEDGEITASVSQKYLQLKDGGEKLSKMEIKNRNEFPIYFRASSTNEDFLKPHPVSGRISPMGKVSVTVPFYAPAVPVGHHKDLITIITSQHPFELSDESICRYCCKAYHFDHQGSHFVNCSLDCCKNINRLDCITDKENTTLKCKTCGDFKSIRTNDRQKQKDSIDHIRQKSLFENNYLNRNVDVCPYQHIHLIPIENCQSDKHKESNTVPKLPDCSDVFCNCSSDSRFGHSGKITHQNRKNKYAESDNTCWSCWERRVDSSDIESKQTKLLEDKDNISDKIQVKKHIIGEFPNKMATAKFHILADKEYTQTCQACRYCRRDTHSLFSASKMDTFQTNSTNKSNFSYGKLGSKAVEEEFSNKNEHILTSAEIAQDGSKGNYVDVSSNSSMESKDKARTKLYSDHYKKVCKQTCDKKQDEDSKLKFVISKQRKERQKLKNKMASLDGKCARILFLTKFFFVVLITLVAFVIGIVRIFMHHFWCNTVQSKENAIFSDDDDSIYPAYHAFYM